MKMKMEEFSEKSEEELAQRLMKINVENSEQEGVPMTEEPQEKKQDEIDSRFMTDMPKTTRKVKEIQITITPIGNTILCLRGAMKNKTDSGIYIPAGALKEINEQRAAEEGITEPKYAIVYNVSEEIKKMGIFPGDEVVFGPGTEAVMFADNGIYLSAVDGFNLIAKRTGVSRWVNYTDKEIHAKYGVPTDMLCSEQLGYIHVYEDELFNPDQLQDPTPLKRVK